MKKPIVMFGTGKIADEISSYFAYDSDHEVVAFTVDAAYIHENTFKGLSVHSFEDIQHHYPPENYDMFVAIGYHDANAVRAAKVAAAIEKGYTLVSYISSKASNIGNISIGHNSIVLENTVLQPSARIGDNTFIWSGNHIGHHAEIKNNCYIAGQVVVSGSTVIDDNCFIGVNATFGHEIHIGASSIIGAGSLITKDVEPQSVFITADTPQYPLDTTRFLQLTTMK